MKDVSSLGVRSPWPGSNQGKICSTDIDCVDKDWPGAIVSYIYFTDDAQPSQGVDENNPL